MEKSIGRGDAMGDGDGELVEKLEQGSKDTGRRLEECCYAAAVALALVVEIEGEVVLGGRGRKKGIFPCCSVREMRRRERKGRWRPLGKKREGGEVRRGEERRG
jgi:hypothetical protein